MIVVDEYLAVRVVGGQWPERLPDDEDLVLPASRHWRLLQRIHAPGAGQLSQLLSTLSPTDRDTIRYPHPEVLQIADPRPLLDEAARIAARYGGTGWLTGETLAAGLATGEPCGLAPSATSAECSPEQPTSLASSSASSPDLALYFPRARKRGGVAGASPHSSIRPARTPGPTDGHQSRSSGHEVSVRQHR